MVAFADEGTLDLRGEAVLDCLRGCHASFRDHLQRTEEALTCSCDACTSVTGLELKFVLHHGTYVAQSIAGSSELLGPDVTAAHRMLKTEVDETTGWRANELLSDAAAEHLEVADARTVMLELDNEHLGRLTAMALPLGS